MPNVITYEVLFEMLRKEKYTPQIQKLTPTFFQDAINYLKEKEKILASQQQTSSVFSNFETQKIQKQIESTKKILKELYEKRETKIIDLALYISRTEEKADLSLLLPEEEAFFYTIIKELDTYRKGILFNLLSQNPPSIEKPKELKTLKNNPEAVLVRFIQALPKFIGDDLNIYGPFEAQDIANLPKRTAELLIEKKKVQQI